MKRPIALDVTRLFNASRELTPQGIHRVEHNFALHLLDHCLDRLQVVVGHPWGVRWSTGYRADRCRSAIEKIWGDAVDPAHDPQFAQLKARLHGAPDDGEDPKRVPTRAEVIRGFAKIINAFGVTLGHHPRALPKDTIYVNVGQDGIGHLPCVSWLADRPDISGVFMLHDVIPIEYPELTGDYARKTRLKMLENTARFAHAVLTPSRAAGRSVAKQLAGFGGETLPIFGGPLGVSAEFLTPPQLDPDLANVEYFLVCGRIHQQKNQILLLNLWRELVLALGPAAPKLVLAGTFSWGHVEPVRHMLGWCDVIRGHVVQATGLSTKAMVQLMAGARALLMPTLTEGFGLPVAESLALGTPVIASNIPAVREAGGPHATYLHPHDGPGWLDAIRAHAAPNARRRVTGHTPRTWSNYFAEFDEFVDTKLGGQRGGRSN